ncbi:MAG: hypothetical protein ABI648_13680 [Betaproteobacteria bacterium]|jgi:hypothetical protein
MKNALVAAAMLVAISPVASAQKGVAADPLLTRQGWEVGGQLSDYRYEEPNQGLKISGGRVGVTGAYTFTSARRWFFKIDGRYSYGSLKYEGSGTIDSVPDSILETRAVLGKDYLPRSGVSLSPFAGFGYRYLYNDLRGTTSTGAAGYQRYSNYWYVPLGLTSRINLNGQWVIAPTIEYDYFIRGRQVSQFTDIGVGYSDATNTQTKGYGYRFSVMAEKGSWAFGPWMHYWKIEDSDIVPIGFGIRGFEPKNETQEFGLEVKYRF